jgi:hypothetical protein
MATTRRSFTLQQADAMIGKRVRLLKGLFAVDAGDIGTILNKVEYDTGYAVQVFWEPDLPASPMHSDFFLPDDFGDLVEEL